MTRIVPGRDVVETPPEPSLTGAPAPGLLGAQAIHGAFWNIFFAVLGKLAAFGGQIALAWFLVPADMGLAGIALAIAGVVFITSGAIPNTLLIQHKDSFEENAGEIFWFSLAMTLAASLLLLAAAPLFRHLFRDPRLIPIILLMAVIMPLTILPTVYISKLYRSLDFRAIAQIRFFEGLIRNVGSVVLAAFGCGAYSLILPQPVGSFYSAAHARLLTGRIPLGSPHPRRWPALLLPTFWLLMLYLVNSLQMGGAVFVIGMMRDPVVTGLYAWGFALSAQAIFLLGTNLQSVFFSVFTKLNENTERQAEAFKKACTLLSLLIVPVCALQILLAHPIIALLFKARWLPAVPVVQWLSVGMISEPLSVLGTSLLLARGEYRLLVVLVACLMIGTVLAAVLGSHLGSVAEIARCMGTTLFFTNLFTGWIACREVKRGTRYFLAHLVPPLLLVLPLLGGGAFLVFLTRGCAPFVSMAATGTVLLALYGCGIWFLAPHLIKDLKARIPFFAAS